MHNLLLLVLALYLIYLYQGIIKGVDYLRKKWRFPRCDNNLGVTFSQDTLQRTFFHSDMPDDSLYPKDYLYVVCVVVHVSHDQFWGC
jgi:hypothetical protein